MPSTTLFAFLAKENGWGTYKKFSIHFGEAAQEAAAEYEDPTLARAYISQRTYGRWMTGDLKGTPRREASVVLAYMFNTPVERLFRLIRTPALQPAHQTAQYAALTAPLPGFDRPSEIIAQAQSLVRANVDASLLSMVATSLQSVVDRYEMLGPHHLAGEARLLRTMLHTMLGGQQPPKVRSELFRLAGRTAGLLGYMAVNAGASPDVAEAYCGEAEDLAREIGDTHLEMWVAGTRSLSLYYQQQYIEADRAALAGIERAPCDAHAIRLLINGRARALARLGDRPGAERAIGQAMDLTARQLAQPDGLTACISFEPYSAARTLANAITARLSLGDVAEVLSLSEEINGLVVQSGSEWSRALVGLDVATALLQARSPEVEHAMDLGCTALQAGAAIPIRSVWQRAWELHDCASPWHNEAAVREYAEQLRTWQSHPPTAFGSSPGTVQ
ncbi:hypothetical protein ACFU99_03475 [Streptomyces sp. NPDC057654]|uniref:hypothetical protein n=1 Tax=Streptomyces sp. NPDC057654 TaxID=3346196 RepID=UPI003697A93F